AFVKAADRLEAARRQPLQADGKQHDQHQPKPEGRRCRSEQGENGACRIAPAVASRAREQTEECPDTDRYEESRSHQQQSRTEAIQDEIENGLVIAEGIAEIQMCDVDEVVPELQRQRL